MGTKAAIKFADDAGRYAIVYTQSDGGPKGIQRMLLRAIDEELVWRFPRFEADEFAAGFISANKKNEGGFRILNTMADLYCDFVYVVTFNSHEGEISVTIGHCKGTDQLDRPDYVFTGMERLSTMHRAYTEDAA